MLDRIHPALLYTLSRLGVFLGVAVLLYLVGFRSFLLAVLALVISAPLSYFLLRRQREAFAQRMETGVNRRREEKKRLRAALSGEDE